MKKNVKRVITLCLALVMLTGLSVGVFAASASTVKQYKNYVVIGDSIPSGYGLETTGAPDYKAGLVSHGELVEGSYPALVANAVGAANSTTVLARCGFRTVEAIRVLDPTYSYDSASNYFLTYLSQVYVDDTTYTDKANIVRDDSVTAMQTAGIAAVKNADLITVNLGSNDTMTYALLKTSEYVSKLSAAVDPLMASTVAELASFGELGQALQELLAAAEKIGETTQTLAAMSRYMTEGFISFKLNFSTLISRLERLNSSAKIVVVGMYNPFENVKLTDQSMIAVGRLANQFVALLNAYMSGTCLYASTYTYVDVNGTQCYDFPSLLSADFGKVFVRNVHPTLAGYQTMANAIFAQLPAAGSASSSCLSLTRVRNATALLHGFNRLR